MSDYASILGGDAPDNLIGQTVDLDEVGRSWDAYYYIESANVFLDRFDSSGNSIVDAVGNPGAVRIELGSGRDTINTGVGSDSIWAGDGNDSVNAGAGDNAVSGAAGDDLVVSGAGNDSLLGGSGDDTLLAGLGDDYLAGGSGADQLMGGAGNDSLFGGSGGDVFAFDSGFGQDVISDFGRGDRIDLTMDLNGTGIASAADLVRLNMISGGTTDAGTKFTLITIGNDTIRLDKVDSADFINQINSWVKVG